MTDILLGYSEEEKEEIAREYFGTGGRDEAPQCIHCGESFDIRLDYTESGAAQLKVSCPGCANGFVWRQRRPITSWRSLDLAYFMERYLLNESIPCPVDDCSVISIEYSEGVIEFRCPYCNRSGRTSLPEDHHERTARLTPAFVS
ncbi:MAG TPA: hypothetical protein VKZ59_03625 [Acidobacteriota bacterium]|nr:hypothetical protein [Acidobacteriota bacterium]